MVKSGTAMAATPLSVLIKGHLGSREQHISKTFLCSRWIKVREKLKEWLDVLLGGNLGRKKKSYLMAGTQM